MNKTLTLILLGLFTLLTACATAENDELSGFVEPEPADYVSVMPAVWEYFHHRKAAMVTGDMGAFYRRYPAMQNGINLAHGINAEASFVDSMRDLAPFDGDIHPEYYERVKIKRSGDEVQVLTHGMELYLWWNNEGKIGQSGGEFKLVLFMRQEGAGWQVFRTDEVTLTEWKNIED